MSAFTESLDRLLWVLWVGCGEKQRCELERVHCASRTGAETERMWTRRAFTTFEPDCSRCTVLHAWKRNNKPCRCYGKIACYRHSLMVHYNLQGFRRKSFLNSSSASMLFDDGRYYSFSFVFVVVLVVHPLSSKPSPRASLLHSTSSFASLRLRRPL